VAVEYRRAWRARIPEYLEILPGAYSGSVCGRSPERQANLDQAAAE
jgi:hypothetical protein